MHERIGSPEWWSWVESRGHVRERLNAGDYYPVLQVISDVLGVARRARPVKELMVHRYGWRAWTLAANEDARIDQAFRVRGRRLYNARVGVGPDSAVAVPEGWELWMLEGPDGSGSFRLIPSEPSPMTPE